MNSLEYRLGKGAAQAAMNSLEYRLGKDAAQAAMNQSQKLWKI
jgi:hypothetical protein